MITKIVLFFINKYYEKVFSKIDINKTKFLYGEISNGKLYIIFKKIIGNKEKFINVFFSCIK